LNREGAPVPSPRATGQAEQAGLTGFFGLSPFPEEREKTQSAFGGKEETYWVIGDIISDSSLRA
jgi:hypothetical protein